MDIADTPQTMDIHGILELLPHRYPMLLVDRILDYKTLEYIIGLKNVTMNEPFFQGHFPGHPIMPGVMIIEAMAQAAGCLGRCSRTPRRPRPRKPRWQHIARPGHRPPREPAVGQTAPVVSSWLRSWWPTWLRFTSSTLSATILRSPSTLCAASNSLQSGRAAALGGATAPVRQLRSR